VPAGGDVNPVLLAYLLIQQLAADGSAVGRYQNDMQRWLNGVAALRLVTTGSGIAGWYFWKEFPLVWAAIIGAAQFTDMLNGVFHFADRHKAASAAKAALDNLLNEGRLKYETNHLQQGDDGATERFKIAGQRANIMNTLKASGISINNNLEIIAESEAVAFMDKYYPYTVSLDQGSIFAKHLTIMRTRDG
jgi:hypothetical protein